MRALAEAAARCPVHDSSGSGIRCGHASVRGGDTGTGIASGPGHRFAARYGFAGLTFYPGHIWDAPDQQDAALNGVAALVEAVLDHLQEKGFACEIVSGGSTPSAFNSHLLPFLTEIRPGTYVFNDRNTLGVGACRLEDCALRVLVTVVSNAVPGRAIIDGGSKTFTSDRWFSGSREGHGLITGRPGNSIRKHVGRARPLKHHSGGTHAGDWGASRDNPESRLLVREPP